MFESLQRLVDKIRRGEGARPPVLTRIDDSHVDGGVELGQTFEPNEHYFAVRLNEMFLHYGRRWFAGFLPMTWVLTRYTRGYGELELPCMVGPAMIQDKAPAEELPQGMLFRDVRVAGVQPYRGGRLSLSIVLHQVPVVDHADRVLSALQAATSALDFSGQLGPYLKVVDSMAETAGDLLDLTGTKALIGCVHEYDPDAGNPLRPGFYALVSDPACQPDRLWVVDRTLLVGEDASSATPLRTGDYVLYSVVQTSERSDAETLGFIEPLWKRVVQFAGKTDAESWKGAKANMAVLGEELYLSPDLTTRQAENLFEHYKTEMLKVHERADELAHLGAADRVETRADEDLTVMRNIVSGVLDIG
jgi:hypothetical protein